MIPKTVRTEREVAGQDTVCVVRAVEVDRPVLLCYIKKHRINLSRMGRIWKGRIGYGK